MKSSIDSSIWRTVVSINAYIAGLLLCISSAAHLNNPFQFLQAINEYQFLNQRIATWTAALIIVSGLILGSAMIVRFWVKSIFSLATILFGIFVFAQVAAVLTGIHANCGCWGSLSIPIGWKSICVAIYGCVTALLGAMYLPDAQVKGIQVKGIQQ
jgi:hypothetical protein